MESNWTKNVDVLGIVGMGASLCSRLVGTVTSWLTNKKLAGHPDQVLGVFVLPAGDVMSFGYRPVDPTLPFPYGVAVDPP